MPRSQKPAQRSIFTLTMVLLLVTVFSAKAEDISRLYFPHVASDGQWETEICLINAGPSATVFGTLRFFDDAGEPVGSAIFLGLYPNQRYEIRVGEASDAPARIGYAVADFDAPAEKLNGYLKFFANNKYRVAIPATAAPGIGDLPLSHIASNDGWWTGIGLLNTTDGVRTPTVRFSDGTTRFLTLSPGEHVAMTVRQLYGEDIGPEVASAVVTDADGVIGLMLFGSEHQLSGVSLTDAVSERLNYPHVAAEGGWWTGVVAYNPWETAADLTVTPFAETGTPLAAMNLRLEPFGKYVGTTSELAFPPEAGWFRVDASMPVTGFELFGDTDQRILAGYTGVRIETRNGLFPKLERDGWTGIALVNPAWAALGVTESASGEPVLLTAFDDAGNAVAYESVTLDAGAKWSDTPKNLFVRDISAATYIEYASEAPMAGFQINGDGKMMLDALPSLDVGEPVSEDFPDAFIRYGWDADRDITELAYGGGAWAVTISQGLPMRNGWRTDEVLPEDYIADEAAYGNSLSHLVFSSLGGGDTWAAVTTDAVDRSQLRQTSPAFPADFINAERANGYRITGLTHDGEAWTVLLSTKTRMTDQTWALSETFPSGMIRDSWDRGYDITEIAYGVGQWAVVLSQGLGMDQSYRRSERFPLDFVRERWADGYRVTQTAFGDGEWAVVMGTNTGLFGQSIKAGFAAGEVEPTCSVPEQNEYLYHLMKDRYLWYEQVPNLDFTEFRSPEALLEAMVHEEKDPWSYITEPADFSKYYDEGLQMGLGFGVRYDEEGNRRVRYVYIDSPAGRAGLKRGDITLEINGKTVEEISAEGLWDSIHGPDEVGAPYFLKIRDTEGNTRDLYMTKEWFTVNTVLHHEVIEVNGEPCGYLAFKAFIYPSEDELAAVFTEFAEAGITELILDLRYNGGGLVYVSGVLANHIAGAKTVGETYNRMVYNDRHGNWNRSISYPSAAPALDLDRVVVITSPYTCSASELVVNGLHPFIDVHLVGDTTCGKPVGMDGGYEFCGKQFVTVNFQSENADGYGDYFDGIPPDCEAGDDLSRDFGDPEEASLKAAIDFLTFGQCTPEPLDRKIDRRRAMGCANRMGEPEHRGFRREVDGF